MHRFRKRILIYLCVLLVLGAAGLGVFYAFVADYERTLPQHRAEQYCAEECEAGLRTALKSMLGDSLSPAEDEERLFGQILLPTLGKEYAFRKDFERYTQDVPVYTVYSEETNADLLRITLEKATEESFFGFTEWNVSAAEPLFEKDLFRAEDYTVFCPEDASLTVNGKELTECAAVTPYPVTSRLTEAKRLPGMRKFELNGLYASPETAAVLSDGTALTKAENGREISFYYPDSAYRTVTLTVPADAECTVDGEVLSPDDAVSADVSFGNGTIAQAAKGVRYTLEHVLAEPDIVVTSAFLGGGTAPMRLEVKQSQTETDGYLADVPQQALVTVTVAIPYGSDDEVTVNGISLDGNNAQVADGNYAYLEDAAGWIGWTPTATVYTVSGLGQQPQIRIEKNGAEQTLLQYENEYYPAPVPQTIPEEFVPFVEKFTDAYVHYTARGGEEYEQNREALLDCIAEYSPAALRIDRAGYLYKINDLSHLVSYEITDIRDYVRLSPTGYRCTVEYDATIRGFGTETEHGETTLIVAQRDGEWKVVDLLLAQ